jgi:hypothetical protein
MREAEPGQKRRPVRVADLAEDRPVGLVDVLPFIQAACNSRFQNRP